MGRDDNYILPFKYVNVRRCRRNSSKTKRQSETKKSTAVVCIGRKLTSETVGRVITVPVMLQQCRDTIFPMER